MGRPRRVLGSESGRPRKTALVLNDNPRTIEEARALLSSTRREPRDNPEQREQMAVIRWRDEQVMKGHADFKWLHAIPNGGHRTPAAAGKAKAEGATSGVWDLFWPLRRSRYPGIYVEMKWGENRLTPQQREFQAWAEYQGYLMRDCYTAEEAKTVFSDYYADRL